MASEAVPKQDETWSRNIPNEGRLSPNMAVGGVAPK